MQKIFNRKIIENWSRQRFFEIVLLLIFVFLLFLLKSAGYFHPYFAISINFILFSSLILSIFIFKAGSRLFFIISLLFWIFAGILKIIEIDVWAERTAIYSFQSLMIGVIMSIIETFKNQKNK